MAIIKNIQREISNNVYEDVGSIGVTDSNVIITENNLTLKDILGNIGDINNILNPNDGTAATDIVTALNYLWLKAGIFKYQIVEYIRSIDEDTSITLADSIQDIIQAVIDLGGAESAEVYAGLFSTSTNTLLYVNDVGGAVSALS